MAAPLITNLCTTKFAILKWLQMLCCIISVLFLIDGRLQWWPYTLIFVCAIVLGILCLATLLIHYFVTQSSSSNGGRTRVPLSTLEIAFNVIALLLCLVFCIVLLVDFAKMQGGEYNHHRYLPPPNIGREGWRNRVLVVAIALALNAICHGISLYEVKNMRRQA